MLNCKKIAWMLNCCLPRRSWLHAFVIIVVLPGCCDAEARHQEAVEPSTNMPATPRADTDTFLLLRCNRRKCYKPVLGFFFSLPEADYDDVHVD